MRKVYLSYHELITAYGMGSQKTVEAIQQEQSGIHQANYFDRHTAPFVSSQIDRAMLEASFQELHPSKEYTRLEKILICSLDTVIKASKLKLNDRVGLIIATTKGNIDVLDTEHPFPKSRAYLTEMARAVSDFFSFTTEPIVLSNACVSGALALAIAKGYIQQQKFDHVFVVAGDLVTPFTVSGFTSFQAMSAQPCKPYSEDRDGITLGEAGACVLVTSDRERTNGTSVELIGEASCNDANHISGPSRTGEGLFRSITKAMRQAEIRTEDLGFISAHGTATVFNDEMESIAFHRAGLSEIPLHSLKGYLGHSLGASSLVETIAGMHSLKKNTLFRSLGFAKLGTSKPLAVIEQTTPKKMQTFLKTASGFGGCNTALVFQQLADES
ncbi:beta-ketoacyl-[acyl-carrier-protein] synthase family protein [Altibacter sp. HG106]|uniref:beta-ketoacyl-[acyl-carrier-protein] synthase family protein n=1 Tax=Altibacter sp. HG106 TaxID=3023937 RepID=UPI002350AD77|nr:beta-ketoacyl synthase N-terminal-like domain-containing protein [Altibacter sp. HG106]MDC7994693.1 beta-ketoacyl synthase N-terminal-like domain-containing protein [Altibacter sp. HG106]